MVFDQDSVQAPRIRKDANYESVRVTLTGKLDGARCLVEEPVAVCSTDADGLWNVIFCNRTVRKITLRNAQ